MEPARLAEIREACERTAATMKAEGKVFIRGLHMTPRGGCILGMLRNYEPLAFMALTPNEGLSLESGFEGWGCRDFPAHRDPELFDLGERYRP